jgi:hypothetical protein
MFISWFKGIDECSVDTRNVSKTILFFKQINQETMESINTSDICYSHIGIQNVPGHTKQI